MENENNKVKSSDQKYLPTEDTRSTFLTNDFNNEASNVNIVLCNAIKEERENNENGTVHSSTATLGLPQTQANSFPKRLLAREAAVDNSNVSTSSSGKFLVWWYKASNAGSEPLREGVVVGGRCVWVCVCVSVCVCVCVYVCKGGGVRPWQIVLGNFWATFGVWSNFFQI